jgi:hypothetical protein
MGAWLAAEVRKVEGVRSQIELDLRLQNLTTHRSVRTFRRFSDLSWCFLLPLAGEGAEGG